MAPETSPALPAETAAAAIHGVLHQRQRITSRTIATIWFLWGFALAAIAALDLFGLHGTFRSSGTTSTSTGATTTTTTTTSVAALNAPVLGIVILLGVVWTGHTLLRHHALDAETARFKRRNRWLLAGLLVAYTALSAIVVASTFASVADDAGTATLVFLTPLFSATVAVGLALLHRAHAPATPGLVAAAVIATGYVALLAFVSGSAADKLATASIVHTNLVAATFLAVGAWHHRHG